MSYLPTAARLTSLCSPLEGISLSDLSAPDLYKTPFDLPRPGMDDGHHGVDFAFWSREKYTTMLGLTVYSALSGKVAGVLPDRPPYGNAVIIETRLEDLPPTWLDALPLPPSTSDLQPSLSLSCPDYSGDPALKNLSGADRSLYLLYAHFNLPSSLQVGQDVSCGQTIGSVRTSGMSVNPHLHLERASVRPRRYSFQWLTTLPLHPRMKCELTAPGKSAAPSNLLTQCACCPYNLDRTISYPRSSIAARFE